jgi:predicted ester cyclase
MSNADIVRNFLEGAWNRKDLSVIDQYIHPNHVSHDPMEGQFPQGSEGQRIFVSTFNSAFPDVKCTINELTQDGDLVEASLTFRGTQKGELMGVPPTGKKVTVHVQTTDRIENGKIVESWVDWDPDDMMRQLGVG